MRVILTHKIIKQFQFKYAKINMQYIIKVPEFCIRNTYFMKYEVQYFQNFLNKLFRYNLYNILYYKDKNMYIIITRNQNKIYSYKYFIT